MKPHYTELRYANNYNGGVFTYYPWETDTVEGKEKYRKVMHSWEKLLMRHKVSSYVDLAKLVRNLLRFKEIWEFVL